jgi:outer membrane lipoprotein-sorting protein
MLMKRKMHVTRIFLVIVTLFSMSSCIRDDLAVESQSQQNSKNMSAKFASRSFWKEDNVYISKVQQIFLKLPIWNM